MAVDVCSCVGVCSRASPSRCCQVVVGDYLWRRVEEGGGDHVLWSLLVF